MVKNKQTDHSYPPSNHCVFRVSERYFKQRSNEPDYNSQCLDLDASLDTEKCSELTLVDEISIPHCFGDLAYTDNESPPPPTSTATTTKKVRIFSINSIPGLLWIDGLFDEKQQHAWAEECINLAYDYRSSDRQFKMLTNLHAHYDMPHDGLLSALRREHVNVRKLDDPSSCVVASEIVTRMRWATLGLQYDWTTKQYLMPTGDDLKDNFPASIGALCKRIVKISGPHIQHIFGARGAGLDMEGDDEEKYSQRRMSADPHKFLNDSLDESLSSSKIERKVITGFNEEYRPEAGIINFYQLNNSLTAHVDRSERNMNAPLISLSLGHSCVFLIGTATRDTKPTALLLKSGQVLVMSGEARRAFHGVPRVIEGSLADHWQSVGDEHLRQLMSTSRINVNVRQVFFNYEYE